MWDLHYSSPPVSIRAHPGQKARLRGDRNRVLVWLAIRRAKDCEWGSFLALQETGSSPLPAFRNQGQGNQPGEWPKCLGADRGQRSCATGSGYRSFPQDSEKAWFSTSGLDTRKDGSPPMASRRSVRNQAFFSPGRDSTPPNSPIRRLLARRSKAKVAAEAGSTPARPRHHT